MRLASILFASSFTLVVATGWTHLDAGSDGDGPAELPAAHSFELDGHPVTVSLDRVRVPAGEAVKLTLATTDGRLAGRELPVKVMVQTGSAMSRVPRPPLQLSETKVRLGSEPVTVAVTLPGPKLAKGADPLERAGQAAMYSIVIGAPRGDREGVSLPAFAYQPEAFHLAIEAAPAVKVGEPVDVAVRVKSLVADTLRGLTISAASARIVVDQPVRLPTLAAGEEVVVHLRGRGVDPEGQPSTIMAFASAERGGTTSTWVALDTAKGTVTEIPAPELTYDPAWMY